MTKATGVIKLEAPSDNPRITLQLTGGAPANGDTFLVRPTVNGASSFALNITDPTKDDFTVQTQQDLANRLSTITGALTWFLVAVASIALFVGDYFARDSKHSGAWMSALRDQQKLDGRVLPIVVNVMSFARGGAGEPCLLSLDEAHTLFHEFGHALHGMLSDVTYPLLSGTNVARDFVELPSQLFEHWLERPETLRRFARHYRTGEPMPEALIERLEAARRFNQGFATTEFVAAALFDMELHLVADPGALDVAACRVVADRVGPDQLKALRFELFPRLAAHQVRRDDRQGADQTVGRGRGRDAAGGTFRQRSSTEFTGTESIRRTKMNRQIGARLGKFLLIAVFCWCVPFSGAQEQEAAKKPAEQVQKPVNAYRLDFSVNEIF